MDRQVWSSKTTISSRGKSTAHPRPAIGHVAVLVRDDFLLSNCEEAEVEELHSLHGDPRFEAAVA
jgi:hypothetical protein